MHRKLKFTLIAIICLFQTVSAQLEGELNCQVQVVSSPKVQVSATDKEVFSSMEESIRNFLNNRRWTEHQFELEERIDCQIMVTITKIISSDLFEGQIQVSATRPVYNSSYNTVLFNTVDEDLQIQYLRNSVLQYSENTFQNNLTSILAYYAYMILGYDYDSFELEGGTEYFNQAMNVVTVAQNNGFSGWSSTANKKKNRYFLIDNLLNSIFKKLRQCYYDYHRQGMDIMYEQPAEGRKIILAALKLLEPITRSRPGAYNLSIFLNGKRDELKNLFSEADTKEKNDVVNLLRKIDPSNGNVYQEILNS